MGQRRHHDDQHRVLAGDAPRPGDPRDRGPRPSPTLRDVGWVALATVLVAVTVWQFTGLAVAATRLESAPTGWGLLLAFAVTVAWLLTIYWLAAGAWRRSVWGCPFSHLPAAPTGRRCPRHAAVEGPAVPRIE